MAHNALVQISQDTEELGLKVIPHMAEENAKRLFGVARYLEALGSGHYRLRKNSGSKIQFKRVKQRNLPNLNVATIGGREVGFIWKPEDTRTDRNAWRIFIGIGHSAKFVGHAWNLGDAKRTLVLALG